MRRSFIPGTNDRKQTLHTRNIEALQNLENVPSKHSFDVRGFVTGVDNHERVIDCEQEQVHQPVL